MKAATKEIRPDELGRLGRDHIAEMAFLCGVSPDSNVEYFKETFVEDGLPFVVEVAFAYFGRDYDKNGNPLSRTLLTGLNFSPTLTDPFDNLGAFGKSSLGEVLATHNADDDDPVFAFAHVASPRFAFTDKGKTAVELPHTVARGLTGMMDRATRKWERQKIAEIRHSRAELRRHQAMTKSDKPIQVKEAAYAVMAEAYHHAAGRIGIA
jgi:hypothetical protein